MVRKLGAYEILAMMPAGTVLFVGLYLISRNVGSLSDILDILSGSYSLPGSWSDLGLLVFIVFVLGALMHSIARILERPLWFCCGGWPSVRLLSQAWGQDALWTRRIRNSQIVQHLYSDQLTELSCGLNDSLKSAIETTITRERPRRGKQYFVIQRQMFVKVRNAGRCKRMDVCERNYGLYSGLFVAFLLLAVLSYFSEGVLLPWLFWPATLVCAFGAWAAGEDCAGELALQFVNLQSDTVGARLPTDAAAMAVSIVREEIEITR